MSRLCRQCHKPTHDSRPLCDGCRKVANVFKAEQVRQETRRLMRGLGTAFALLIALAFSLPLCAQTVEWQPGGTTPDKTVIKTMPCESNKDLPAQCPGGQCPPQGGGNWGPPGMYLPQPQPIGQQPRQPPQGGGSENAPIDPAFAAASVRIDGQTGGGSATVFFVSGGKGYAIGCRHVTPQPQNVTISWTDGKRAAGQTLAIDTKADLACYVFQATYDTPFIPIADAIPQRGTQLAQAGYPAPGRYLVKRQGQFLGHLYGPNYAVGISCRSGDSGSGVFDANGKTLIGVLWGTSNYTTCVTSVGDMQRFVKEACHLDIRIGGLLRPKQPAQPAFPSPGNPPVSPPPATTDPAIAAELARLKAELDALKAQPGTPGPQGPKGDPGPPGGPGTVSVAEQAKIDAALSVAQQAEAKAAETHGRLGSLKDKIDTMAPKVERGVEIASTITNIAAAVPGPWQGPAVALSLGLGAVGTVLHFRRRRQEQTTAAPPAAAPPQPDNRAELERLRVENEALKNRPAQTQTRYVEVDTGKEAEAWRWAAAKMAHEYPGMAQAAQMVESLAKQRLSGQAVPERMAA